MQFYIVIGPDQPRDFSNPNVHDPATAIPDEQAKQMLDWFCFQRPLRSFANRRFRLSVRVN